MKLRIVCACMLVCFSVGAVEERFEWLGAKAAAAVKTVPASQPLTIDTSDAPSTLAPFTMAELRVGGLNPSGGPVHVTFFARNWGVRVLAETASTGIVRVPVPPFYTDGRFRSSAVMLQIAQDAQVSAPVKGFRISAFSAEHSSTASRGLPTESFVRVAQAVLECVRADMAATPLDSPDLRAHLSDQRRALAERLNRIDALRTQVSNEIELGSTDRLAYRATMKNLSGSDRIAMAIVKSLAADNTGFSPKTRAAAAAWLAAMCGDSPEACLAAEAAFISTVKLASADTSDFSTLLARVEWMQAALLGAVAADAGEHALAPQSAPTDGAASAVLAASGTGAFSAGAACENALAAYRAACVTGSANASELLEASGPAVAAAPFCLVNSDPGEYAAGTAAAARSALAARAVKLDDLETYSNTLSIFSSDGSGGNVAVLQNGKVLSDNVAVSHEYTTIPLGKPEAESGTLTILASPENTGLATGTLVIDGVCRSYALTPGQAAVGRIVQVFTYEPKVKAPTNPSPNRTTYGIGEYVSFKSKIKGNWSIDAGGALTGNLTNSTAVEYRAGASAGTSTIKCAFNDGSNRVAQITFTVIVPAGLAFHNAGAVAGIKATDYGAGMKLDVTVTPTTVSFSQAEIIESDVAATSITGFFAQFPANSSIFTSHNASPNFQAINTKNIFGDTASVSITLNAAAVTLLTNSAGGSFEFDIPVLYRRAGDTDDGTDLTTVVQTIAIANTGTVTITKGGASESRKGPKPPKTK